MIHFNEKTKTFSLLLKMSQYAFQVDGNGRLHHLTWSPRPADATEADLIAGDAYFEQANFGSMEQQMRPDEIITYGDVSYHEVSLKVNFPTALGKGQEDAPHAPVRDVRLQYVSHEIVTDAGPGLAPTHGLPPLQTTPRETLKVLLRDPVQPLQVTLCYRLTPEHDIIERWVELENVGKLPVSVEQCYFAALHLPNGRYQLTSVTGSWAREFMTQRHTLPIGMHILEHRTVQTGHMSNPFFLLNQEGEAGEENGTVYFGQLAYSGSWRLVFETLHSLNVRVHGGYNSFDFQLDLAPGAVHKTPAMICGLSLNGRGGASRRMHAHLRKRVLPAPAKLPDLRPVLYNSWEATYFGLNEQGQIELARKAAEMGVELFCLDDGWFGGRRFDNAGLGDWFVSPAVFPNGLHPLIDEVHRLGMSFGLWVEPEMVNADSDLYRQHPDWILHFPGRERTEARNQLVLDMSRPEVAAAIYDALDKLLSEHEIGFIKWDMNRYQSEPGSVAGKSFWMGHVTAVYDIIDRLRSKYPHLAIQSCSGGGGRIDAGILARTDQVWTSDNTDALTRVAIQEGFSLAYPARTMEAWVTHQQNHQTGRIHELSLRFDVAMRGVLGIGSDLNALSDSKLKQYKRYITFYKRFRHVVQQGDLYRLQLQEPLGASVVQYVLPGGEEAVYSAVVVDHKIGQFRPSAPLKGLNSNQMYALFDEHSQQVRRMSGYELMTRGIPGHAGIGVGSSLTLYLQQE
ncbi:MAG: alpha-galactosidase [Chloroflexi bacterium]|nr:alpha-galactosidase [Chloroflexota bacterium]